MIEFDEVLFLVRGLYDSENDRRASKNIEEFLDTVQIPSFLNEDTLNDLYARIYQHTLIILSKYSDNNTEDFLTRCLQIAESVANLSVKTLLDSVQMDRYSVERVLSMLKSNPIVREVKEKIYLLLGNDD